MARQLAVRRPCGCAWRDQTAAVNCAIIRPLNTYARTSASSARGSPGLPRRDRGGPDASGAQRFGARAVAAGQLEGRGGVAQELLRPSAGVAGHDGDGPLLPRLLELGVRRGDRRRHVSEDHVRAAPLARETIVLVDLLVAVALELLLQGGLLHACAVAGVGLLHLLRAGRHVAHGARGEPLRVHLPVGAGGGRLDHGLAREAARAAAHQEQLVPRAAAKGRRHHVLHGRGEGVHRQGLRLGLRRRLPRGLVVAVVVHTRVGHHLRWLPFWARTRLAPR
mmetsp:Transcript_37379/g.110883  ORF Transcript_37379/g.110883 Transcript_37379/m.110883 type:complete len:279 (+) Transcript_37379:405-1241(+)